MFWTLISYSTLLVAVIGRSPKESLFGRVLYSTLQYSRSPAVCGTATPSEGTNSVQPLRLELD